MRRLITTTHGSIGGLRMITAVAVVTLLLLPLRSDGFQMGYFRASPHAMPDDQGNATGVAVEYFLRIAEKMSLPRPQFQLFPLQRLLVALETGQLDAALLFGRNADREARFVYPRQPFCYTQPSIAVSADKPLASLESVDALLPLSIQESAGAYRSAFMRDPRLQLVPLHGDNYTARCFQKLVMNRIDACYQPDHYPLVFEAEHTMYDKRVRVIRLPEPPIGLYSVFTKASARVYLTSYEAALAAVARELSYDDAFDTFSASAGSP